MADIRVKDLDEAVVPGPDYYLLTDSETDGVKKVKTTNIVKPDDIGLDNVDNTSDVDKPVSTAQQEALDLKADKETAITAGTGLTGGGDLSADRSIALNSSSIASLLLADSAVQPARSVSAGAGLTGGGDLSENRSIALDSASIASLGLADSAVQPGDLSGVATSGDYDDLTNKPTLAPVATSGAYDDLSGKPTLGSAAAEDVGVFATAAQGGKADTALQSVVAGTNVTIDDTDPRNPIINASGGGGGVPAGGTTGQVLAKASGTDYDTGWVDQTGGVGLYYNVMSFGAVGDGATDDTAAIQDAIDAAISAGGGVVYFPAASVSYKTSSQLLIDLSSYSTRFQSRLVLRGDGPGRSAIENTTSTGAVLKYLGKSDNIESYFTLDGIRLTGGHVSGSIGFQMILAAWPVFRNMVIEGFDTGFDNTDMEQAGFYDCEIRFNAKGMTFHGDSVATGANSMTFVNCCISNNSTYGITVTHTNAFTWLGGSVQYNGSVGGGAGQYGIKLIDTGFGLAYGTVLFSGMAFEGNGGAGDVVSDQSSANSFANFLFSNVAFERTAAFGPTVGYGTNNVSITGSIYSKYAFRSCTFMSGAGYTADGARKNIVSTNAAAFIQVDGTNIFRNTVEAPTSQALYLGEPGQSSGSLLFGGSTSGVATVIAPAAAGTPILTLPTTTGTLQVDTGSAWDSYTPTVTFAGGGSATLTASGRYRVLGNKAVIVQVKINISNIGSATGSINISTPAGLAPNSNGPYIGGGLNLTTGAVTPFTATPGVGYQFYFAGPPAAHIYGGTVIYEVS
ncbi:glycosyl hydrolase family 28-related protein [Afipia carboxidovorans]|uniref:glycosyl hydrolase family 28-related protein n=1 Tax=Afipia carboxidovorans TaxID=40137 RepID=UPI003091D26C|nr:hypothetical protein CRBSH125_09430 [Afipia carboxidovorans]